MHSSPEARNKATGLVMYKHTDAASLELNLAGNESEYSSDACNQLLGQEAKISRCKAAIQVSEATTSLLKQKLKIEELDCKRIQIQKSEEYVSL
jgi:hypothetical protein